MGWRLCVLAVVCAAGCIRANLVECDDGRVCPDGTVCDTVHASCVTPEQTAACGGFADGEHCDARGTPGICDQGICLPGCGDGANNGARGTTMLINGFGVNYVYDPALWELRFDATGSRRGHRHRFPA